VQDASRPCAIALRNHYMCRTQYLNSSIRSRISVPIGGGRSLRTKRPARTAAERSSRPKQPIGMRWIWSANAVPPAAPGSA
jgi:hypothetical protein